MLGKGCRNQTGKGDITAGCDEVSADISTLNDEIDTAMKGSIMYISVHESIEQIISGDYVNAVTSALFDTESCELASDEL